MKQGQRYGANRFLSRGGAQIAGFALVFAAFGADAAETVRTPSGKRAATPIVLRDKAQAVALPPPAPPPAPMGVIGAEIPAPGKLVLSITPIFSNLSGIKMGTRTVSNEFIVSTVPFFLDPRQMVRIVPQNIAASTETVSLNYGIAKDFSALLTAGLAERNLDAVTFKGTSGIRPLGHNYPGTVGLADFTLSGVYRAYQDETHRLHFVLGLAFPTGLNSATFAQFLLPDGTRRDIRAFYGMQPGAGTFDLLPGVVYAGYDGAWSWGLSYRGRLPLAANRQGYRWGDLHEFTGWGGYSWTPGFTTTLRISGSTQGPIRGFDPQIRGAAVPANPLFYGGQRVELFGGATISGKFIGYENTTLAVEAGLPVYQNLNGPQIMKSWQAGMSLKFKI